MPKCRSLSLAIAFGLSMAPPAGAADCAGFEALIAGAETGFSEALPPLALLEGASCQTVLELGGKAHVCFWEHSLKAPEAAAQAQGLERDIQTCFPEALSRADLPVNHPDSYAAREYTLPTARITVAVKDKAQLRQTLVFLRVGVR